jgi:hypothetical protein
VDELIAFISAAPDRSEVLKSPSPPGSWDRGTFFRQLLDLDHPLAEREAAILERGHHLSR